MTDLSLTGLIHSAGQDPWLQGAAVAFGTFILEDAATVVAAMQVKTGGISMRVALIALYLGIVAGDLGVYALGALAARFPWARYWRPKGNGSGGGRNWICDHVFRVVFISRFIPGARLPTYTVCGFMGANVVQFVSAAVVATLIWTSLLFALSLRVGQFLIDHLGAWRWAGLACFIVAIVVIGRLAGRLHQDTEPE